MKGLLAVASLCFMLGFASAVARGDQLVVVASSLPELPRGAMLDGSVDLSLAAGDTVTLVSRSGEIIELEGPSEGPPSPGERPEGDPSLLRALGQLLESRRAEETPGVVRSVGGSAQPPDPWWVDTTRSGHYCVPQDSVPLLWRPRPERAETLEMKLYPSGGRAEARWQEGEVTATWPVGLPLQEGASYSVRKGAVSRRIILHLLAAGLEGELHQLVALVREGCMPQARILTERLDSRPERKGAPQEGIANDGQEQG